MFGGAFIACSRAVTWIDGTGYVVSRRDGVNGARRRYEPARRRCFAAMARHPLLLCFIAACRAEAQAKASGGEGGIRTPDRLAPMPHFECGAFDHSATSPGAMMGGLPPLVGRSSRRGWLARQGAGTRKSASEVVPRRTLARRPGIRRDDELAAICLRYSPLNTPRNIDHRLREGLRGFLRQVVADAAGDGPVRIFPREHFGIGAGFRMRRAVGVAFHGDGGHGDDRRMRQAAFPDRRISPRLRQGRAASGSYGSRCRRDPDFRTTPRSDRTWHRRNSIRRGELPDQL